MTLLRMMLMRKLRMILYKDLKRWVPLAYRCGYISSLYCRFMCMLYMHVQTAECKCPHNAPSIIINTCIYIVCPVKKMFDCNHFYYYFNLCACVEGGEGRGVGGGVFRGEGSSIVGRICQEP